MELGSPITIFSERGGKIVDCKGWTNSENGEGGSISLEDYGVKCDHLDMPWGVLQIDKLKAEIANIQSHLKRKKLQFRQDNAFTHSRNGLSFKLKNYNLFRLTTHHIHQILHSAMLSFLSLKFRLENKDFYRMRRS